MGGCEYTHKVQLLLGTVLDALVLRHCVAPEDWEQACIHGGRFCEPHRSWVHPDPEGDAMEAVRRVCANERFHVPDVGGYCEWCERIARVIEQREQAAREQERERCISWMRTLAGSAQAADDDTRWLLAAATDLERGEDRKRAD